MHNSTTILLLTTVATTLPTSAATFDHSTLDTILRANVRDERVDYLNIRDHHFPQLVEYLDRAARQDPSSLSREEQLALYLNVYNATMIHTVASRFVAGYSVSEKDFAVFDEPLVRLRGTTMSLNDLEHKVIRKEFQEPRIHAALVCAARSCPPLPDRAFTGKNLDSTLERLMKQFVRDEARNRVDALNRTLQLSQIFNWYAEDFGGKEKLAVYVSKYFDRNVRDHPVAFQKYSWDLNILPPRGKWVQVSVGRANLTKSADGKVIGAVNRGTVLQVLETAEKTLKVQQPYGVGAAWIAVADARAYASK